MVTKKYDKIEFLFLCLSFYAFVLLFSTWRNGNVGRKRKDQDRESFMNFGFYLFIPGVIK